MCARPTWWRGSAATNSRADVTLVEAQAEAKARDLQSMIARIAISRGTARLTVGASAGIAPLQGELSAAQILDAADRAMYARKKERRG